MGRVWWGVPMGEGTTFASREAKRRYDALVRAAERSVVGLDFDGTLSPLVDDPTEAHIHPEATEVLSELAGHVRAIAVITGRPAEQALALGGLEGLGDVLARHGTDLYVFGQYGNQRWSTARPEVLSPPPPPGLAAFVRELPGLLHRLGAVDAWIEDKHIAVAVHTRRLRDPDQALARLVEPMRDLAATHDLVIEPGRHVVEARAPGMHKGDAVRTLARELDAGGFLFAGDDLGDVDAFDAVTALGRGGMATLLVCSDAGGESALAERADVVVPGPEGVLRLLRRLSADAAAARSAHAAD